MPEKMKVHKLKILPKYFEAVIAERKTFEIRKNDRGFEVGDILRLEEHEYKCMGKTKNQDGATVGEMWAGKYSKRFAYAEITYILQDPEFLIKGYAALGITLLGTGEDQ